MILALSAMGTTWTAVFYVVAVVLFILAGIGFKPHERVSLVALGLACAFFPVMWNALAAT